MLIVLAHLRALMTSTTSEFHETCCLRWHRSGQGTRAAHGATEGGRSNAGHTKETDDNRRTRAGAGADGEHGSCPVAYEWTIHRREGEHGHGNVVHERQVTGAHALGGFQGAGYAGSALAGG